MAYAAALFADSCLRGLNGTPTVECTYVESTVTDAPFFASRVKLSTEGEGAAGGAARACLTGGGEWHGQAGGRVAGHQAHCGWLRQAT